MSPKHLDHATANTNLPHGSGSSDVGVGLVIGIVVGGVLGLVSGLAQYNALFSGAPGEVAVPGAMTLGGGILGTALGAALGFAGDALGRRWKQRKALRATERAAGREDLLTPVGPASGRPAI